MRSYWHSPQTIALAMPKQLTFATQNFRAKRRKTRRELFLDEMDAIVPWAELVAVIEPHYPTEGRPGRPPMPLQMMLRVYCIEQWFGLSDEGTEDALYDMESLRQFAGLELNETPIPDATTLLKFRRRLEKHGLTSAMFEAINAHLEERRILLQGGTMVDATLIHAAPSTKNRAKQRDPQMHQTKKGNQWYFGAKLHIGADVNSGVVHTVGMTAANAADITVIGDLLREDDRAVFGDSAYQSKALKRAARAAGVFWGTSLKGSKQRPLTDTHKRRNRKMSSVRARVEHPFRVLKCQFHYRKARYRGLAKNAAQVFMLMGLTNLYMVRRRLAA